MNPKEKDELREFPETLKYDLKYFVTESQEETLIITKTEADYLLSLMLARERPQQSASHSDGLDAVELLEKKLNPQYMNTVFTWAQIKMALEENKI